MLVTRVWIFAARAHAIAGRVDKLWVRAVARVGSGGQAVAAKGGPDEAKSVFVRFAYSWILGSNGEVYRYVTLVCRAAGPCGARCSGGGFGRTFRSRSS